MNASSKRTFSSDFKQFFLRGLVVLLPSVLTLWLVVKAYQFVDTTIAQPINTGVRVTMGKVTPHLALLRNEFEPAEEAIEAEYLTRAAAGRQPRRDQIRAELRAENIRTWWSSHWQMELIGLVVAIVAVYIAGRLVGGWLGRRIYRRIEALITTLPVFKQVYPYVKQVVDFLFSSEQPIKFNRVVVVEYPRKGIWSVGFLTGETMRSIAQQSGDSVTVFIPSSPTPFTGYTITVPSDDVLELPISVEEAMRFAVTGGVLVPDHQTIRAGSGEPGAELISVPGPDEPPPPPPDLEEPRHRDAV
ncbi:MAG: DUF502 domain-containing protein [Planctomycetota bacterium]|jgi:uncharacterized membrane protein